MSMGQRAIAEYFLGRAAARDGESGDHPTHQQNARAAVGLRQLAAYVLALPAADERIVALTALLVRDRRFLPFAEGTLMIARFRFDSADQACGAFLTKLVRATAGYAREP